MKCNTINTYMFLLNRNNTIIFSCKTDHKKYVINIDLGVVFHSDLSFGTA